MKFEIKHRWTGEVLFTAEIEASENTPLSIRLGLAVRVAVKGGAYLSDADLRGAYLSDADLRGADLSGADLRGADLRGAYLSDADLRGADLRGADLRGAYLRGADLRGADLRGAYLSDADLRGADLRGADLRGAKWRDGIIINRPPLQISGLRWPVTILDRHMQIGCEFHALSEWAAFDDRRILKMEGRAALDFWRAHGAALLALAASDGRGCADSGEAAA